MHEETGLTIEVGRLVGVYSHPDLHQIVTYPDGNVIHFVSLCFEGTPTSGELALSDETTGVGWWASATLPHRLMAMHRVRIVDALAGATLPFIR